MDVTWLPPRVLIICFESLRKSNVTVVPLFLQSEFLELTAAFSHETRNTENASSIFRSVNLVILGVKLQKGFQDQVLPYGTGILGGGCVRDRDEIADQDVIRDQGACRILALSARCEPEQPHSNEDPAVPDRAGDRGATQNGRGKPSNRSCAGRSHKGLFLLFEYSAPCLNGRVQRDHHPRSVKLTVAPNE